MNKTVEIKWEDTNKSTVMKVETLPTGRKVTIKSSDGYFASWTEKDGAIVTSSIHVNHKKQNDTAPENEFQKIKCLHQSKFRDANNVCKICGKNWNLSVVPETAPDFHFKVSIPTSRFPDEETACEYCDRVMCFDGQHPGGTCGCSCHKKHESEDGLDHLNGDDRQ